MRASRGTRTLTRSAMTIPRPFPPSRPSRGRPAFAIPRPVAWLLAAGLGGTIASAEPAGPPATAANDQRIALRDSTTIEAFTLSNGLRVVTRHVPLSGAIAITIAFDRGERDDPENRAGLARLLGKLRYFAATDIELARTREHMQRTRPAGWDLQVATRTTRMSEVATLGQFPGIVHQMAARLRGVRVDEAVLRSTIASVREDLAACYGDSVPLAVVFRTRALAEGLDEEAVRRRASGAGIEGIRLREVQELLARQGTRQAVLSLAGDMKAFPMRRLLENEFGSIPASAPLPPPEPRRLVSAKASSALPAARRRITSVGILAPALHDTLHPEFYAAALRLGGFMLGEMGRPGPSLSGRFYFQPFDDPELALFYPESEGDVSDAEAFRGSVTEGFFVPMSPEMALSLHRGVDWMLGGPLVTDLLVQSRGGGPILLTLSSTAAIRALWGDETFWSRYRERFFLAFEPVERADWKEYFLNPSRRVDLQLAPPDAR